MAEIQDQAGEPGLHGGSTQEPVWFLMSREVGPVFKGALNGKGETACRELHQAPLTAFYEGLGRRRWGVQGPELDTSVGLGGRLNKSNKGPMYIQANSFCFFWNVRQDKQVLTQLTKIPSFCCAVQFSRVLLFLNDQRLFILST